MQSVYMQVGSAAWILWGLPALIGGAPLSLSVCKRPLLCTRMLLTGMQRAPAATRYGMLGQCVFQVSVCLVCWVGA